MQTHDGINTTTYKATLWLADALCL